jgi:integrase
VEEQGKGVREVQVVDVIRFFLERHEEKIQAKSKTKLRDYLNTVERLINFWSGKTVHQINEKTIAEYRQKARPGKPLSPTTTLRELAELKTMVNFSVKKGILELRGHIVDWELPPPPAPRMTFYTRSEVGQLVWTAYRKKNMAMGKPGVGIHTSKHIARFLLIAVKTGTRAERIETASFKQTDDRPWIDLETGIYYRAGVKNKSPANKRADPVRLPADLLSHLRRWAKEGDDVIRSQRGVGSTRKAFFNLKHEVFSKERAKVVNRHTCKHTCASWLMQRRVPLSIIANYLSTTEEVIKKHYGHFSPDFHKEVEDAHKAARSEKISEAEKKKKAALKLVVNNVA